MDNTKLRELIARKNEQLEQRACDRAREIIDEIGELQVAKVEADRQIVELRNELKTLQVSSVDPINILGE